MIIRNMEELDKAYEAVEMLRELDLPVSKDQLENIDRLEKENGTRHRDDLRLYFYEQSFAYYTKRISNIQQAKIHGEVIVAKQVLLLAIIDGIELNVFAGNKFQLTEWLEERYMSLMRKYMYHSQFDKPTDISNPFWHLATDGFWHLQLKTEAEKGVSPSRAWLKENVKCARFDDDLWVLLENKEWRTQLREFIVTQKLAQE